MSGFKVYKVTASPVVLDDLGVTLTGIAGTVIDLTHLEPTDVARSTDLVAAINGTAPFSTPELLVVDPRDDSDTTNLSAADSLEAVARHNDTHFGISGGRFGTVDHPGTSINDGDIIRYDSSTGEFAACNPSTSGSIWNAQGIDGIDTTFVQTSNTVLREGQDEAKYDGSGNNGTFVGGDGVGGTAYNVNDVITLSDGSQITVDAVDVNGDVTQFTVTVTGNTNVTAGVPLTQTGVVPAGGTNFSLTPQGNNISEGTIQWDVDDVFLRNTGDTLDSGTLTIASGAAVTFNTTSSLTFNSGTNPTATLTTPTNGFQNATDMINKGYVDALVQGIDWKESVRRATTPAEGDLGGTFVNNGGVGDTITYDSTTATGVTMDGWEYTGNPATGLDVGDRVLVKDNTPATENGIYVVTAGSTPTATILTRATDQDGSPGSEVSGGNTTFVETGTLNGQTIWSVVWDGQVTINTDPMNWTQTGAATNIIANEGLNSTGNRFNLDIGTLTQTATITTSDVLAFQDVAGSAGTDTTTTKTTVANFLGDLNIVTVTTNGIIVNNGGTYTTVSIAVNGPGPLDGLAIANADGTGGNPTLGLDIQNLPYVTTGGGSIDAVNDQVAVWDSNLNRNVYYTVSDIAGAAAASNSYTNWTRTGNGSGGPIGPGTSADTIQWIGGIGIDINMSSGAPDTIEVEFTRSGMADTAVQSTDTFPFFDGSNADEPEYRSFADMLNDLNIVNGITPNGIVVQTAADTYAGKAVAADTLEDFDGLNVTNGDGTAAGNIIVGLDIDGMTASAEDMAATDEFAVHNKSQGTAGANRNMTGQEIADGVANILNITSIGFATFTAVTTPGEDQTLLAFEDSSRADKVMSVESMTLQFSDSALGDNSWLDIGDAIDADSGYIMPLEGTIVMASAHCENTGANTFVLDVYVGAPAAAGTSTGVVTLAGGANASDSDPTLNITFNAGDKIRMRARRTVGSGSLADTVASLIVRWSQNP